MTKLKQHNYLSPEQKALHQIRLSFQWACIDSIKYENFANRLKSQGFDSESKIFYDLAEEKKHQAWKDLDYLLPVAIPAFNGYKKDVDSIPMTDVASMILSAMSSELDQKCYLYRTASRKLNESGNVQKAIEYDRLEKQSHENLKLLQELLDKFLKNNTQS